jgi:phosphatidylethanolamine/phosphatidyl-N-methylethanolamine N-methyltransferase
MLSRDKRLFFLRWLSNPWRMGVPVPSSRGLARAMAAQLSDLEPEEYVLELGPGTGVVTRALCQAGVKQQRLVIIESDAAFIRSLRHSFPDALILRGDACNLREILLKHNIRKVAAVVSSLPLLSMPDKIRQVIVNEAFKVIKTDGVFIQYTYGLLSPVPAKLQRAIGIRGRIAKRIWRNFPPARVWRYTAEVLA